MRAFVDIDSLLRPVHGHHKQGASYGHTKIGGKQVLRKGLSPLVTTLSTDTAAPVITGPGRSPQRRGGRERSVAAVEWVADNDVGDGDVDGLVMVWVSGLGVAEDVTHDFGDGGSDLVSEFTEFGAVGSDDVEVHAAQTTIVLLVEGERDLGGSAQVATAHFAGQDRPQRVVADVDGSGRGVARDRGGVQGPTVPRCSPDCSQHLVTDGVPAGFRRGPKEGRGPGQEWIGFGHCHLLRRMRSVAVARW